MSGAELAAVLPVLSTVFKAASQLVMSLQQVRAIKKHNLVIAQEIEHFIKSLNENIDLLKKQRPNKQSWALESLETDLNAVTCYLEDNLKNGRFRRFWEAKQIKDELERLRQDLINKFQLKLFVTNLEVTIDADKKMHDFGFKMMELSSNMANSRADTVEIRKLLEPLVVGMKRQDDRIQSLVSIVLQNEAKVETSSDTQKFLADVLASLQDLAVDEGSSRSSSSRSTPTEDDYDDYLDPITADLMIDPVKCTDGETYDRLTVLKNNLTQQKQLVISCDDESVRRRLFKKFREEDVERRFYRQRKSYRDEALELADTGHSAEALTMLKNVLMWAPTDKECLQRRDELQLVLDAEEKMVLHLSKLEEDKLEKQKVVVISKLEQKTVLDSNLFQVVGKKLENKKGSTTPQNSRAQILTNVYHTNLTCDEEGGGGGGTQQLRGLNGWRRAEPEPEEEEVPTHLNTSTCGHFLTISADKLSVKYVGIVRHSNVVGAIQGNRPAPHQRLLYYFEILLKDRGKNGYIAIGFTDENFNMSRQPGWEPNSYGYHGDDGKLFHGPDHGVVTGKKFGPTFTTGDTVGAGINYAAKELFFTKNGKLVGTTFNHTKGPLYPTVGMVSQNEEVEVNFGQKPFIFEVDALVQEERKRIWGTMVRFNSDPKTEEGEVPTHLNTSTCGHFLAISADKLSVKYIGIVRRYNDVGAIQGNRPAPHQRLLYYFEILLKDRGKNGSIAIGFTDENFNMSRQPGWEPNSYGYHGDDGKLFHGPDHGVVTGKKFGPTFTTGDTVGAGINYGTKELFFTKNGKLVGTTFNHTNGPLYPTVGMVSQNEEVEVNFGRKAFIFEVDAYVQALLR